ncbi:Fe-S cluster assembly protein SufD [Roseiconus lacunae]|uniref:Fe-S cluster assembly protein SufD n=1 Tax=Roseiconus lacunae TaxID=2605694 RepID=A0ABT7PI89_9BACT|nr:Fe-S cluster assembly protein SufD [Roseiconus lacunae]MCD0461378.1 Fe-S cluster assembly protein SufD [Roseiconus lacunae]MDM4016205.1 Fe-S cluster assembly protein SufD [Roseiconus lacunae]WRQ51460.1 Fe-S cluster assembly protein SufD [Stieleria sp. HD01]
MSSSTAYAFDKAGFDALLDQVAEPDWLVALRREAFEHASKMDWPHRRHEEWIRTDIRAFQLNKFGLPSLESSEPTVTQTPHQLISGVELGGRIETVDSAVVNHSLASELESKGVVFGPLSQLANSHADLVRPHLFTAFDPDHDKFAALHAAFMAGGQFLYVPRGVTISQPLHIGSIMTDGGTDTTHTLVVLEEGAEATVLHEYNSVDPSAGGLHLGSIELIQKPGSNLRFVSLQEWGHKAYHFAQQKAVIDRDCNLQWTIAAMGSMLSKVNQTVDLVGPGADSQVNGVMFTEGRQHLAYHTQQHHRAPSCHSDFLYKSAQQDNSRTVWRGMIKVDPIAQKTDGYQRNDNLVLSPTARADSIPGLEIEADDVRCTHGSTTSKVDEEQLFYARCRGFTQKEATRMIVTGFFQQIFDRITIESVREALGAAIARQVREYE